MLLRTLHIRHSVSTSLVLNVAVKKAVPVRYFRDGEFLEALAETQYSSNSKLFKRYSHPLRHIAWIGSSGCYHAAT